MGTLKCISYMAGTLRSSTDTSTESSNRFSRRVGRRAEHDVTAGDAEGGEAEAEPVRL